MKFSTYEPAVNRNIISPPAVQAPRDEMAFGTGGKEWGAFGSAVGQMTKVAQKLQDDQDAADTMDARNRIMTALTDKFYGENGLLETGVGENAQGLTGRVTKTIRDTFDDVSKDYNGRVRFALRGNLNENMANFQRIAASQEMRERENVRDANFESSLDTDAQLAALNYGIDGFPTTMVNSSKNLILARGKQLGWSGEQIEAANRDATTKVISGAAQAAIDAGEIDRADSMLTFWRKDMDQSEWNRIYASIKKQKDIRMDNKDFQSILAACRNPDGSINLEKGKAVIEAKYGPNAMRWQEGTASYSGDSDTDNDIIAAAQEYGIDPALVAAVASAESGYNQSSVSPAGAIGMMQLMPGTAQSLGVDANDKAQNIQGGAKYLAQLLSNFGGDVDKAIMAYNAGPEAVKSGAAAGYRETQEYLKRVRENLEKYKHAAAGGGIDIGNHIYYQVASGKEGEVTGLNHNTWTKLQALAALYEKQFGQEGDYESFYVTAGAATGGHNEGSKHYQGAAFDIAMDSLKRHPERLEWLQEHAGDVGLIPFNEYDGYGNEQYADGENFHFSDNGEELDTSPLAGRGGHQVSAYDPVKQDAMLKRLGAAYSDELRAKKQKEQDFTDSVELLVRDAGSREAAVNILEQNRSQLTPGGYSAVKSAINTYYPAPRASTSGGSRGGGYAGGGGAAAAKALSGAGKNIDKMAYTLEAGGSISASAMFGYRNAGNILEDGGGLSAEDADDVTTYESDSEFQSNLTDDIEANGLVGAYNHLRQSGMSATAAAIILSKVDPSYTSKEYQGDTSDDDEEEG